MADASDDKKEKGLYLAVGGWASFAFLFRAQALALQTAWILNQAANNSVDRKGSALKSKQKWIIKNAGPDAEQEAQEHLFRLLTKCCCHVIKNMELLMKEEVDRADTPERKELVNIDVRPATCLWSALTHKFLGSEPALITAATTALVKKCATFDCNTSNWDLHFQGIELDIAELQQRGTITVEILLYCLLVRGFVNAGYHWDMLATLLQQEKAPSLAILCSKAQEHIVFRKGKPSGITAHKISANAKDA